MLFKSLKTCFHEEYALHEGLIPVPQQSVALNSGYLSPCHSIELARMSNAAIQKGERVELKSGGPVMTVQSIFPDPYGDRGQMAHCEWFDQNENLKAHDFVVESLKKD